jgi:ribonuclease HII
MTKAERLERDIRKLAEMKAHEDELRSQGHRYIAGIDEVGRGPLAGPVYAACVVLPTDFKLEGLNDSKKLTEKKRNEFYNYLIENVTYGVGVVNPKEIDKINIYEASRKAMILAIEKVRKQVKVEYVLTDAMPIDLDIPVKPIIKGDAKSITIAAASVIAKVTRDKMMYEIDQKHPEYGFKNHKGYPTKKHIEAINKYGLIEGYRKTYGPVKKYIEEGKC